MSEEDIKYIDPKTLTTPQECDDVMYKLDCIGDTIQSQLELAAQNGTGHPDWNLAATHALRHTRRKRAGVQMRKSHLRKAEKTAYQNKLERSFMDAAIRVLPKEELDRIYAEMRKEGTLDG